MSEYQVGDHGWAQSELMKPFEANRIEQSKSAKGKNVQIAIAEADFELSRIKGGAPLEPLQFKSPASKTPATTPAVQRTYSRTPFSKDAKRNFDAVIASPDTSSQERKKSLSESSGSESKRVKIESTSSPRKRTDSSPAKASSFHDDDDDHPAESGRSRAGDKMEAIKLRPGGKPSNLKFGFIGLSTTGKNVLQNLMDEGHDVTIWNRTSTKCKEFEKKGASVVKTPGDVIREADITFCCLSDADASSKIFFGNCGVASEINASKGYVELTSLDPTTSMDIETYVK